jgi:hypothetical protein
VLQKRQRHVLAHGLRGQQRTRLEQHAESQAYTFKLALLHRCDFFAKKLHHT